MNDNETMTVAVLAERVDNLRGQVAELSADVKKLVWKVALIAGGLGASAGLLSARLGG